MERQRAADTVRTVGSDGSGHVEQTNDAVVRDLRTSARHPVEDTVRMAGGVERRPVAVTQGNLRFAAEEVGIRYLHAAFAAIDLEGLALVLPDIPGMAERDIGTVGESEYTVDGGRHLNVDGLAGKRRAGDRARQAGGRHVCRDTRNRTEQIDQLRHIVGSKIMDRSATMLVENARVRMPVFHSV